MPSTHWVIDVELEGNSWCQRDFSWEVVRLLWQLCSWLSSFMVYVCHVFP